MGLRRMDHVGIVVDDLAAATAFFAALGFALVGEGAVEGEWVGRVIGLDGDVRSNIAMLETPDGHSRVELSRFHTPVSLPERPDGRPTPSNTRGIRHLAFLVDDLDAALASVRAHGAEVIGGPERYENVFRLCYVRGPEGIIVELAEELG